MVPMWIEYCTGTGEYTEIACVTSTEAKDAVNRLFGNEADMPPYIGVSTLRWWEFYGAARGDYN